MESELLEKFRELIARLEIVWDAVRAKKKEQALEAMTQFLRSFLNVYGHSKEYMSEMSSHLEHMKNLIQ